jgi:hypothetical protein
VFIATTAASRTAWPWRSAEANPDGARHLLARAFLEAPRIAEIERQRNACSLGDEPAGFVRHVRRTGRDNRDVRTASA